MSEIKLTKDPIALSSRGERQLESARENVDKRDPKMLEAARSFENQFLRQMISEMRKTVPKDELMGDSMAENIFRDQLDGQYADSWVNEGGTGLADMIYDQLQERYGNHIQPLKPSQGEVLALKDSKSGEALLIKESRAPIASKAPSVPRDILAQGDKSLFLAKKGEGGFLLKSREPLPEKVGLRSPLAGVVLQAAALEDGREMIVVKHDQGLVSQLVHTGHNKVQINARVAAGEILAELPASKSGEGARVFFGMKRSR